jgi:hypothetical protein
VTYRQIHPLNKSGVQSSREAQSHQGHLESGLCPKAHHSCHTNQLAPSVAFLHLAIDQTCLHLPLMHFPPSATHLEPLTEVSREGIEVEVEPVTRKERKTARGKALSQGVNNQVGHVLRAGAELKCRKNLGARIDGQPQPEYLSMVAQACAQFIQLQVWEPEMEEEAFVQDLRMFPCARQKG